MVGQAVARLQWLSPAEGGRKKLPSGPKYTTVARFEQQRDLSAREGWSLVVEFMEPPDETRSHLARVKFLVSAGPPEWLGEGSRFELMEGPKPVAKGLVIQSASTDRSS